jgi:exodeoxyribonuclease VII large subunit
MFRSSAAKLKFVPENGMRVTVRGSVSVYTQGGSYQLYATSIEPDGVGTLYMMYEQLKARLEGEGLFSEAHKKPLLRFPSSVGVITSPSGAAVRDIINVTGRRFPSAKIYIYPALVQGDGAEADLIKALDYFEESKLADVIIIGRGGGSIEDLWAFNSEALARRIFSHSVPIISAVGHETDFTICDFVSDRRAPTPSAAAEIAVPDQRELIERVDEISERATKALKRVAGLCRERLERLKERRIFSDSAAIFEPKRNEIARLYESSVRAINSNIKDLRAELITSAGRAQALSPLAVLMRGFSVIEKDGVCVNSVDALKKGDFVSVRMSDGVLGAEIIQKEV